jgi:hypothetical protein
MIDWSKSASANLARQSSASLGAKKGFDFVPHTLSFFGGAPMLDVSSAAERCSSDWL